MVINPNSRGLGKPVMRIPYYRWDDHPQYRELIDPVEDGTEGFDLSMGAWHIWDHMSDVLRSKIHLESENLRMMFLGFRILKDDVLKGKNVHCRKVESFFEACLFFGEVDRYSVFVLEKQNHPWTSEWCLRGCSRLGHFGLDNFCPNIPCFFSFSFFFAVLLRKKTCFFVPLLSDPRKK